MNHLKWAIATLQLFFGCRAQRKNIHTSLWQAHKILARCQIESLNLRLPKLETFVPEKCGSFVFVAGEVNYHKIVSVNINGFISDKKLFVSTILIVLSQNLQVGITYVKFMVPHGEVLILSWIILYEFQEIEPNLSILLVAQEIELFCVVIINDVTDQTNTE